jgi:hypothetical protein
MFFEVTAAHAPRLDELMAKYADLPMDLADASLVLLAEHLGHRRILSMDVRDFRAYRWQQHAPFDNLLHLSKPPRQSVGGARLAGCNIPGLSPRCLRSLASTLGCL